MQDKQTKLFLFGIVLLIFANFFVWQEVASLGRGGLEVIFFDVGQGDAIFIETASGHQILIDGGPKGDVILEKLSNVMPFWDRTLDMVILTHPDYDHQNGLISVLNSYKVKNILWTGVLRETRTFEKWVKALQNENANIMIAQKGQALKIGNVLLYILHPFESLEGVMFEKGSNKSSIVAKLVFGDISFLFLGDIGKKEEEAMLPMSSLPIGIGADVLKIAHHGSKYSSSRALLGAVQPEVAVISVGKDNNYGHPTQEVLNSLNEFGIKVLRTDERGDIKFITNDGELFVNNSSLFVDN